MTSHLQYELKERTLGAAPERSNRRYQQYAAFRAHNVKEHLGADAAWRAYVWPGSGEGLREIPTDTRPVCAGGWGWWGYPGGGGTPTAKKNSRPRFISNAELNETAQIR